MHIAHFWATAEGNGTAPDGRQVPFKVRRGSDVSIEDARRIAEQAARDLCDHIRRGGEPADHYDYDQRQLVEPIIEDINDADGSRIAAITINRYGCEVLNTMHLGFLDIDLVHLEKQRRRADRRGFITRLFGGGREEARSAGQPTTPEGRALQQLDTWIRQRPSTGVRAYRTAAGLRYLFVHPRMNPLDALDVPVYAELGCDPLYQRLCVAQGCFRARLSPKPWRIGVKRPPGPRADLQDNAFIRWRTSYNAKSTGFAVCAMLQCFGDVTPPDPMTQHLIELHDELTGATTGYPLA